MAVRTTEGLGPEKRRENIVFIVHFTLQMLNLNSHFVSFPRMLHNFKIASVPYSYRLGRRMVIFEATVYVFENIVL